MRDIRALLSIISLFLVMGGCNTKESVEKKTNQDDRKDAEEFYKQFDSTITIEKLDSFKTKWDSINNWRDTKRKRTFF